MSRTLLVFAVAWAMTGTAHAQMQKGDTVTVAAETTLKTRPTPDAGALAPAPAGATATLGVRITNATGNWWYAEVAGQKGWLPESALAAAAPATPAPVEAPVAVAAPAVEPVADAAPPVVAPPPAAAAGPATHARALTAAGSTELALAFELAQTSANYYDTTYTVLDLKFGRCTSDLNELGLNLNYLHASESDVEAGTYSVSSYTFGPFYTRNLPDPSSNLVPFFTLSAGIARTESEGFTIKGRVLEVSGGARWFAAPDFSVNLTAYYNKTDQDYEGFSLDTKTVGFRVGVSGFLR